MARKVDRRIYYNPEDYEILKRLKSEKPFSKLNLIDIFAISIAYGKKQGFRTPLDGKKTGRIRNETVENSDVNYLMMAIGVEETGSLDVLSTENEYFTISEKYEKTGISLLEQDYLEDRDNFIKKLELEALEYYDNFIEEE